MSEQCGDERRAEEAADLAGGVHGGAHDAHVAAADVEARAPRGAEGEHGAGDGEGDEANGGDGMVHEGGADHGEAGAEIAEAADPGATETQAETPRGEIGGRAAEEIAEHANDEWKAGEKTEGERGEAVFLFQIGGQPGDAEIERAAVGNVGEAERQGVAMSEEPAPVSPALVGRRGLDAAGDDEVVFGGVDRWVLGGVVAEPTMPDEAPDETDGAEDDEDAAPTDERGEADGEDRRETAGEMGAAEEDALDASAFREGNPAGECARNARPGTGFAGAEEEAHDEHRSEIEGGGGGHGEGGPPEDDAGEDAARALSVGPPRGGDFEDGVGEGEGAENPAHLLLRKIEIAHDVGRERAEAGAIEVSDHRKGDDERDHAETDPRGAFGRGRGGR